MSIYKKTTVDGWQPQQLTLKDVKFATWIAFFAWVFAVYDFILFGTLLPEIGNHFNWNEVEQAELATWVAVGDADEIAPTALLLASEPGGNLYVGQTLGPNSGDVMP